VREKRGINSTAIVGTSRNYTGRY